MSFLQHDMTPVDTANYYGSKSKSNSARDPADLRPRRGSTPREKPDVPEISKEGRARERGYFQTGLNMDGTVSDRPATKTSSRPTSRAGSTVETPESNAVLNGVSSYSKKPASAGYHGLSVHEDTSAARKEFLEKRRAETRESEKRQLEERAARKKVEREADEAIKTEWIMEKPTNSRPPSSYDSNSSSMFQTSRPSSVQSVNNPPPRHKHSLEKHAEVKDTEYLEGLAKQRDEDRDRKKVEQESNQGVGLAFDEIVVQKRSDPKRKTSGSIEQPERQKAKKEDVERRREELQKQIQEASLREDNIAAPPTASNRLSPVKQKKKDVNIQKVNSSGADDALSQQMSQAPSLMDEMGKGGGKPKKVQHPQNEEPELKLTSDKPVRVKKEPSITEKRLAEAKAKNNEDLRKIIQEKERRSKAEKERSMAEDIEIQKVTLLQYDRSVQEREQRRIVGSGRPNTPMDAPMPDSKETIEKKNEHLSALNKQVEEQRQQKVRAKKADAEESQKYDNSIVGQLAKDSARKIRQPVKNPVRSSKETVADIKSRTKKDNIHDVMSDE